ncbi:hypothetical protein JOD53_001134 [Brevibacterium luteolum]|nr:hypothetical protein [Brevibacterium luteolum]
MAALKKLLEGLYGTYSVETSTPAPKDRNGTYIHLHSYSNLVLYPYGFDNSAKVPNSDALRAGAFRQSHGNDYATGAPGDVLYNASGGDFDWVYRKLGVPGYVYEIGTGEEGGFFPGFQRADNYWKKVGPASASLPRPRTSRTPPRSAEPSPSSRLNVRTTVRSP